MTKKELQVIVDIVNKEHDCYFECIMHGDDSLRKDELVVRKFLLTARRKFGCSIEHSLYTWRLKMEKLNKEV